MMTLIRVKWFETSQTVANHFMMQTNWLRTNKICFIKPKYFVLGLKSTTKNVTSKIKGKKDLFR